MVELIPPVLRKYAISSATVCSALEKLRCWIESMAENLRRSEDKLIHEPDFLGDWCLTGKHAESAKEDRNAGAKNPSDISCSMSRDTIS